MVDMGLKSALGSGSGKDIVTGSQSSVVHEGNLKTKVASSWDAYLMLLLLQYNVDRLLFANDYKQ